MARHVLVQPAGAGQVSYDVTSEAAMTGEDLSKLNPGTLCVTLDTGATYEAYPTGTTPPVGATTIAAVNGVWVFVTTVNGGSSSFVYRPGGTASLNVYTSWPALYAALNVAAPVSTKGFRPPTTIQVDDSFTSPAVMPAGAYNLDSVQFTSVANIGTNSNGAALNIASGVTITAGVLVFRGAVNVTFLGAAPCITVNGAAQQLNLFIEEGAGLQSTGAGAFVACTNGLVIVQAKGAINIGNTVVATITGVAPGTVVIQSYTATAINANATSGAGVLVLWDTMVPSAQGVGVTILPQVLGYIPGVPANWSPAPGLVGPALDQLAARGGPQFTFSAFASLATAVQQAIPPGSGATTSSADTVLGAIATKAGFITQMAVQHTGNAANVAGQTITYQVFKNGVAVATASIAGVVTTAGVKKSSLTFAAVAIAVGDVLVMQMLPSAVLTAALTDVMASVQ
jgi:hypothetical protein